MKLSGWVIIVIGLSIGLSALAWSFFQIYTPYEAQAKLNTDYKAQLQIEAGKQKKAEERVRKAMAIIQARASEWNQIVLQKTPPDSLAAGGINLNVNPYQLVVDSAKFRNNAQRAFNSQVKIGGIKVISAPQIPFPGEAPTLVRDYYSYPAVPFPVVIWNLGTVNVAGTYKQIVANVRAWSRMPRYLAVADGLRIDGTSPNLTASYNVTLVGFIRAKTLYPDAPGAAPTTPGGGPAPTTGAPRGRLGAD